MNLDIAFILVFLLSQSQLPGPHERSQDYMLNKWSFESKRDFSGEATNDEFELPMFDVAAVAIATNEFSDDNKLGEGGFGCVYKVSFGIANSHQIAMHAY